MLLDAFILAILAGLIKKGSLSRLQNLKIKAPLLFIAAFILQYLLPFASSFLSPTGREVFYLLLLSYLMLVAGAVINGKDRHFLIMGFGVLLNLLVIAANGGMPVSLAWIERLTAPERAAFVAQSLDPFHVPLTQATSLKFLADVIPFPVLVPPSMSLISLGDILLSLGIFTKVYGTMVGAKTIRPTA
ncbi:MAG: DUF5317 family protein [Actinomycetota bacterium]|nr:DUF5317 family protein [Actinomycetota bacterium]